MKESVTIRDLQWEDFEQHTKNFYGFYDELKQNPDLGILVGGKRPKMTEEVDWFASFYKNLLSGDAIASVAEVDGRIVGMCNITRVNKNVNVRHIGTLGIAIIKGQRGKGIGTKLISSCLKKAKGKFEIVKLSAFTVNPAAIRLYKNAGFEYYGTGKKFIKRGKRYIDEYFMSLEL
jgi:RimJ/RimL family protein N-acetyltransferase